MNNFAEKMKIIHLAYDEKFIDFIADVFNSCSESVNQFMVVAEDATRPLKYLAKLKDIRVIDRRYIEEGKIREDLADCDALIVHYLDRLQMKALLQSPRCLPIVWSGWGGDYYGLMPAVSSNIYGPETSQLRVSLAKKLAISERAEIYIKSILKPILYVPLIDKAMQRINYFSAPIPDDFEIVRKQLNLVAEYKQINYASVESTFKVGTVVGGANVLVGNSASASNNHLEIFRMLSKIDLKDRQVVVPLSYGDADYRDAVIEHGRDLLGESFRPIVDFVPLEQYNTMISQCSVVVMGHRRQQAVGNIGTMLYNGSKVFLDETVTTYQFLKKRGAFIYGLHEFDGGGQSTIPLSNEQKLKNRDVLERFWGHDAVLSNVRNLIESLQSRRKIVNA